MIKSNEIRKRRISEMNKFGSWFVVAVCVFLFTGMVQAAPQLVAQVASQTSKAESPKIEFKETRYEFGSTEQKKAVEHKFEFVNAGTGSLLINKVVPG
ncbi:secreted protein [Candidatus Magnetobacterium bavaricum]|uniref:Secreted protein n=1 Tax=Candidatus Magnetobacterium bavaricum TaxID=29290 RepID=A0A0F3GP26_9BACT|nr:secreted protein [Candidatus Magnetobacterium bavaricum]